MKAQQFEQKIANQCKLTTGINEVFVNQFEYSQYYGVKFTGNPNQMQKMFCVMVDGGIEGLCLTTSKAWALLKDFVEIA